MTGSTRLSSSSTLTADALTPTALTLRFPDLRFVGIDGEYSSGILLLQLGDDRQHALEFFFHADCRCTHPHCTHLEIPCQTLLLLSWLRNIGIDPRSRPRRLASDIENVCAFFEQSLRVCDSLVAIQKLPTVGERIRRHIDDPHDQR